MGKVSAVAEIKVLKTDICTITMSDVPGAEGVTIETASGMKISLTSLDLDINNVRDR